AYVKQDGAWTPRGLRELPDAPGEAGRSEARRGAGPWRAMVPVIARPDAALAAGEAAAPAPAMRKPGGMIRCENVFKTSRTGDRVVEALRGVDLSIDGLGFYGIM